MKFASAFLLTLANGLCLYLVAKYSGSREELGKVYSRGRRR